MAKGVFMDTPGLNDEKMREQAAKAISEALRQNGVYRIFFVITLDSGRVRPDDKTTMQLVIDACKDVQDFCYSIIINKLSKKALKALLCPPDAETLLVCLMEGLSVVTTAIQFLEEIDGLKDEDMDPEPANKLPYALPDDVFRFVLQAPMVHIDSQNVCHVKETMFEKLQEEFEERELRMRQHVEEAKVSRPAIAITVVRGS